MSPFVSFLQRHEDVVLDLVRIFASSTPEMFNQHEYRPLIGDYMAAVLAHEFADYPLSEGRLLYAPAEGYDMIFEWLPEGYEFLLQRRISLKSVQVEIFERPHFNSTGKYTTPKEFVVKNRLGKGTGTLERNFSDLLLLQRVPVSKAKFSGLLYGVACASFDNIREHSQVTNDQIKVQIPNVSWDYFSGVRRVSGFQDVSAEANEVFRHHLCGLYEELFELGKRNSQVCENSEFTMRTASKELTA